MLSAISDMSGQIYVFVFEKSSWCSRWCPCHSALPQLNTYSGNTVAVYSGKLPSPPISGLLPFLGEDFDLKWWGWCVFEACKTGRLHIIYSDLYSYSYTHVYSCHFLFPSDVHKTKCTAALKRALMISSSLCEKLFAFAWFFSSFSVAGFKSSIGCSTEMGKKIPTIVSASLKCGSPHYHVWRFVYYWSTRPLCEHFRKK